MDQADIGPRHRTAGNDQFATGYSVASYPLTNIKGAGIEPCNLYMASRFRLQARRLSLTFPTCSANKNEALSRIITHFGSNLDWAVVSAEHHENGDPHLHVAIGLKFKLRISDPHFFDFVGGQHGNYQATKNTLAWLLYITKEDREPAQFGINVKQKIRLLQSGKNSSKSAQVEKLLLEGGEIPDIIETVPGFTLMHLKAIQEFQRIIESQARIQERERKKAAWKHSTIRGEGYLGEIVTDWIRTNLYQERARRQKQLYIYGETEMGKSTLIEQHLINFLSVYIMSTEEYQDDYNDNDYDLMVIDDFDGNPSLNTMLKIAGGDTMKLKRKGLPAYTKSRAMPLIVISNTPLDMIYPNISDALKAALKSRFEEIRFNTPVSFTITMEDCVICQECLNPETIKELGCGHAFHSTCIEQWTKTRTSCPTCRAFTLDEDNEEVILAELRTS